jgi:amino acid adenylation domain-containing protein
MIDYTHAKGLHQLVEEQVAHRPGATALVFEKGSLTYGELNLRANRLANHLVRLGTGPDERVVLFLDRSLELVVGMLAVLKTGAAYVPVDPAYPVERAGFMLQDAKARVVLTMEALRGRLPPGKTRVVCLDSEWSLIAEENAAAPFIQACERNLAYVIYTSGSTGRPKGVSMPHGPLLNLLEWQQGESQYQTGRRTLNSTSPSFDVSFQEIFSTLGYGGTLVIFPARSTGDLAAMLDLVEQEGVDRIFVPFVVLRCLAELVATRGHVPETLREVITAGEQLQITPAIRTMFESGRMLLVNQYGPTETHVVSSYKLSGPAVNWPALPPIGQPIHNVQLHILDDRQQPVPEGAPGELYAGGAAPARGYLNREDLTQERFIADPFSAHTGGRLYRTGDLVRRLPSGQIEFLGRKDQQVKVRGFRIELGEIEAALGLHPGVRECGALARPDGAGDMRIEAFLVARDSGVLSAGELQAWLQQKLPVHMIPSVFIRVESLPQTLNGKLDRKALAAMPGIPLTATSDYVAPGDELEAKLCEIWRTVLKVEGVGIKDNFFERGGHSLTAVRLVTDLQQQFKVQLSLADLFSAPTIAEQARRLRNPGTPNRPLPSRILRGSGTGVPLFYIPGIWGFEFLPRALACRIGASGRYFDGFEYPGLNGGGPTPDRVEGLAANLLPQLEQLWPKGPYFLAGYSFGGTVAFELARQLEAKGRDVPLLVLLDSTNEADLPDTNRSWWEAMQLLCRSAREAGTWFAIRMICTAAANKFRYVCLRSMRPVTTLPEGDSENPVNTALTRAETNYHPGVFNGKLTLVKVQETPFQGWRRDGGTTPFNGWERVCPNGIEVIQVKGDHRSFLQEPEIYNVAEIMSNLLAQANQRVLGNQGPDRSAHAVMAAGDPPPREHQDLNST